MNESIVVPEITDDQLISAWVIAMHGWIKTGADEWEFKRMMLEDELHRRNLGRKRLCVKFDQEAWDAQEAKPVDA